MIRICLMILCLLVAAPYAAQAQSGAVGTGEDGCYFGRCDDEAIKSIPTPEGIPPTAPNTGPLACTTHFGNCQMAVSSAPGWSCHCPFLANGGHAIGVVQAAQNINYAAIPNIGSICLTPSGNCQMGVQVGRFASCYCPTFMGLAWGTTQ